MDGSQKKQPRGRGRATTQNVAQGARKPREGEGRGHQAAGPSQPQSAWGRPTSAPTQAPPIRPSALVPVQGMGRATLHHKDDKALRSAVTASATGASTAAAKESSRGAMRGSRTLHECLRTRPAKCVSKRGQTGREVILQGNYFRCLKKPEWSIYQYRVDFSPDIEFAPLRKGLIRDHSNVFGGFIFDGTQLFMTKKLQTDPMVLVSKSRSGEAYTLTIKFVAIVENSDSQSVQVLNLILRGAMEGLNLQLVGRNFFDAAAKIDLREFRIELWPGYTTSFRQHEQDLLLCAEITHKVMRNERVYEILQKCIKESRNFQDTFRQDVIGMVVLTDYNNKTYRINDIDFDQSPLSTFPTKTGNLSFVDYYKQKYNITIQDHQQPLLLVKSKERDIRAGQPEFISLIPELCRATGLTENLKNHHPTMKAMGQYTRLTPAMRIDRLRAFNKRLYDTKASMERLTSWQMNLDKNLVEMPGRILNQENIIFDGQRKVPAGEGADWTREFRNNSLISPVNLQRWFVIVTQRNQREASEFVRAIKQVAGGMRMTIAEPIMIPLADDRNTTYAAAVEKCCAKDPQLLMVVVPNASADRYSHIKKKTCVERAVASQVIVHRTIAPRQGKPGGLLSVATKVAIQMNCKLAGAPWVVEIPVSGLMTVGFDVCHSARDPSRSFGALVATMDLRKGARYFSAVTPHAKGQELSNEISVSMTKALQVYREVHNSLPDRILFYRDGVGEGQLHQVFETEVVNLKKRLDEIYRTAGIEKGCRLAFIVVNKRINSRYFYNKNNPPPGTVVDDVITMPQRYDFYLVSQSVKQGTVSPTSYNIIHDTIGLDADKLQILTYKMTHMYYNWSGTTRVPAMCQYAHKLAFLVAQYIHQVPSALLEKQLYFL